MAIAAVGILEERLKSAGIINYYLAFLPLLYLILIRGLVFMFYRDYPENRDIAIVTQTKYDVHWRGKAWGHVPTVKEWILSFLLMFGTLNLAIGGIWLFFKAFPES